MGSVRIIVLAVAAVAAIGLALVVQRMIANRPAPPPVQAVAGPAVATVRVLTAKRALPSGSSITQADMEWRAWPADALNPAFITDQAQPAPATGKPKSNAKAEAPSPPPLTGEAAMQAVAGAIVRDPILENEPIVASKIVKAGEGGFLAAMLLPGTRAVALPVTVESAAGGFVLPCDRVDGVVSKKTGMGGGQQGATTTVLQNVRVLAIDQKTTADPGAKTIVGSTATLEVPAADAPALLRAKSQGDVQLMLRSYADMGGPTRAGGVGAMQPGVTIVRYGQVGQASAVAAP